MKRCTECGSAKLEQRKHKVSTDVRIRHRGRERALPVEGEIVSPTCTKCGTWFDSAADLEHFELSAAEKLVGLGIGAGGILRFARKSLGMRASDLAELLDVTPETISHWENDKGTIDRKAFVVLRDLVRDRLRGRTSTRDQLAAFRNPRVPTDPLLVEV